MFGSSKPKFSLENVVYKLMKTNERITRVNQNLTRKLKNLESAVRRNRNRS
jgi:hypothetical protein